MVTTSPSVRVEVTGARGASLAEVARSVGSIAGIPIASDATDEEVMNALTDGLAEIVSAAPYTVIDPVVAKSTANVTVSNPGTAVFDGITLSNGDRLLLGSQSSGAQNGIYVFNGSGSALTRATDFDQTSEVVTGSFVQVNSGSQAGAWVLVTTGPITVGTTAQVWRVFSYRSASKMPFMPLGAGAKQRTTEDKLRERVSVKDFGAVGDGVTNDRTAMVAAYAYCAANSKTLYFPAGVYLGWLVIEDEEIVIQGDGSAVTTIKLPAGASHTITVEAGPGTSTGAPCVLDFGQIGAGNSAVARSGGHISGLTLDGNKANVTAPANDLHGWGLAFTKFSGVTYDDVVAKDCHAGGIGTFINSNYHNGSNWHVSNCGFNLGHPGFDVNSSKYSVWSGISDACKEGARLLDNCRNNSLDISIVDADRTGFIYGNQLDATPGAGNFSENNDIVVRVDGGCSVAGVQVGAKCASGTLTANVANCEGYAVHEVKQTNVADNPRGLHYKVASIRGAVGSCKIGGDSGVWDIATIDDGQPLSAGVDWAVNVFGDNNTIRVTYQDSGTKLRGVQFNAGADNNRLTSYTYTNTVQALLDSGTGNKHLTTNAWTVGTGTASRGAFAAAAAGTAGVAYAQAELQGALNRIATIEARLLAMELDTRTAGVLP